ncbi:TPA: GhoT/OrtT family toxin [Escherichia coli]|nr:GhoT/OrtT family toxin [Escherichia coli]
MNIIRILIYIYITGFAVSTAITFMLSDDPVRKIKWLAAILIGLTWPLSLPVALLFALIK